MTDFFYRRRSHGVCGAVSSSRGSQPAEGARRTAAAGGEQNLPRYVSYIMCTLTGSAVLYYGGGGGGRAGSEGEAGSATGRSHPRGAACV